MLLKHDTRILFTFVGPTGVLTGRGRGLGHKNYSTGTVRPRCVGKIPRSVPDFSRGPFDVCRDPSLRSREGGTGGREGFCLGWVGVRSPLPSSSLPVCRSLSVCVRLGPEDGRAERGSVLSIQPKEHLKFAGLLGRTFDGRGVSSERTPPSPSPP